MILEIFGRRARTREGALQVEHAHLNYQKSRLVRSWTHLERQRGGFGFLGGPGETQLEADRRVIEDRIKRIEGELDKVKRTRKLHRDSRKRVPYPIVALVGYTNAGKSTLFNRMTTASVLSADMLFATLDPTLRAVDLPHGNRIILSDTVGFISDLPTMLVAAFRATLEEVIEADVILHVRDMSHEDSGAQSHDVEKVLGELGIEAADPRLVEVWNKIDRLDADGARRLKQSGRTPAGRAPAGAGFGAERGGASMRSKAAIEARLAERPQTFDLALDPADGAGLSWLYRHSEVLSKEYGDDGQLHVTVRADADEGGAGEGEVRPHVTRSPQLGRAIFRGLGLVPKRVHFGQGGVLRRLAARRQRLLDRGKTPLEFQIGGAQGRFRIGAEMTRQIDHREQQVADSRRRPRFRSPASSAASISSASSRILASTARGSFQSKPTWPALSCSLSARVRAGRASGTPARALFFRRRAALGPFAAFPRP